MNEDEMRKARLDEMSKEDDRIEYKNAKIYHNKKTGIITIMGEVSEEDVYEHDCDKMECPPYEHVILRGYLIAIR